MSVHNYYFTKYCTHLSIKEISRRESAARYGDVPHEDASIPPRRCEIAPREGAER